jgi:UDP-GlcNAc:undecaprenyl-phosphate/decaprenyl-phosphate GlcNAc-1-phosphate transferase
VSKWLRRATSLGNIVGVNHGFVITLTLLSAAVLVAGSEPLVIRLLRRMSALDLPTDRSSHTVPTPRGGGAPIAVALVLAALVLDGQLSLPFVISVAAFGAIGLADDLRGLPAMGRLPLQAAVGLAASLVLVGWAAHNGPLAHVGQLGLLGLPSAFRFLVLAAVVALVATWIVGFVNAFNFMDGINGISAAHAVVGGVAYAALGAWHHDPFLVGTGAVVAVCALAFLPWNAVDARVFLGDVGSYALGAALAVLSVSAVLRGIPVEAAAAPIALYLADTGWTLQRRVRAGERWFEAHRTHAYQRLCDVGWSHQQVTLATALATGLLCLLGAASLTGSPALRLGADAAGLAVLVLYLCSPAILGRSYPRPEPA